MEETQMIELLHDWKGYDDFAVQPREELIICDKAEKKRLFYCAFYERVRDEMPNTIPKYLNDSYKRERHQDFETTALK